MHRGLSVDGGEGENLMILLGVVIGVSVGFFFVYKWHKFQDFLGIEE